jgi:hypothetical protein
MQILPCQEMLLELRLGMKLVPNTKAAQLREQKARECPNHPGVVVIGRSIFYADRSLGLLEQSSKISLELFPRLLSQFPPAALV